MARIFITAGAFVCLAGAVPSVAAALLPPEWIATPKPDDVCRVYPDRAREQGIEGRAVLVCDVAADDNLENCSVQSETPEGWGFGEAASGVASRFVLRPSSWPMGVPVRLPVQFKLPCNPEAGPASPPAKPE